MNAHQHEVDQPAEIGGDNADQRADQTSPTPTAMNATCIEIRAA